MEVIMKLLQKLMLMSLAIGFGSDSAVPMKGKGSEAAYNPLHFALTGEIAKVLIDAGDDPQATIYGGNLPIHTAAAFGHLDTLRFWIQQYPELINAQNFSGDTPLHLASRNGLVSVVKELLAPICHMPRVVEACSYLSTGHSKDSKPSLMPMPMVILLRRFLSIEPADVSIQNKNGKTALDIANEANNEEIVKLLSGKQPTRAR